MRGNFECQKMKKNVTFYSEFPLFGNNSEYLKVECDSSSDGQVLLLMGAKDFPEDAENGDGAKPKGPKVSSGGIAGIVIGCAIVASAICAFIVYYVQRIKIDNLKNEIPAENTPAYKDSNYETRDTDSRDTDITSEYSTNPDELNDEI